MEQAVTGADAGIMDKLAGQGPAFVLIALGFWFFVWQFWPWYKVQAENKRLERAALDKQLFEMMKEQESKHEKAWETQRQFYELIFTKSEQEADKRTEMITNAMAEMSKRSQQVVGVVLAWSQRFGYNPNDIMRTASQLTGVEYTKHDFDQPAYPTPTPGPEQRGSGHSRNPNVRPPSGDAGQHH